MEYRIGQIIHGDPVRVAAQHGPEGPPLWYAFQTPPRKEASAQAWLQHRDIDVWFPTEKRWRLVPRARVKRQPYEAVVVPRYIFARFTATPAWHVLRTCRFLSRVVGVEDRPLPIAEAVMSDMAQVPARLEDMRAERERRRTITQGDRVEVKDGTMSGFVVDVREVHAGIARIVVPLFGDREAEVDIARLRKLERSSGAR